MLYVIIRKVITHILVTLYANFNRHTTVCKIISLMESFIVAFNGSCQGTIYPFSTLYSCLLAKKMCFFVCFSY